MGYTQAYLMKVVFASEAFLAVLGFIPGLGVSLVLYNVAERNIYIPFPMPPQKIITVFCFILIMCFGAGLLAIRKLKAANPADMF
jgi:putative ABC transport system permease protein